MRPCPLVTLAVGAAALLAGCAESGSSSDSSERFQGDQRLVANAIEDLQSAAAKGDEAKICRDLLARALADRLARAPGGCTRTLDAALKDTDAFELAVESVQVAGRRATARVRQETGDRDRVSTLTLVRERGGWKIADV